jgi:hypothetical protein
VQSRDRLVVAGPAIAKTFDPALGIVVGDGLSRVRRHGGRLPGPVAPGKTEPPADANGVTRARRTAMTSTSPARLYAGVFGTVLLVAGIIGFFYESAFTDDKAVRVQEPAT